MAQVRKGVWRRIRSAHYGEAGLWLLFVLGFAGALDTSYGHNDQAAFLAGVCALAALGVRVTRLPKDDSDAG